MFIISGPFKLELVTLCWILGSVWKCHWEIYYVTLSSQQSLMCLFDMMWRLESKRAFYFSATFMELYVTLGSWLHTFNILGDNYFLSVLNGFIVSFLQWRGKKNLSHYTNGMDMLGTLSDCFMPKLLLQVAANRERQKQTDNIKL